MVPSLLASSARTGSVLETAPHSSRGPPHPAKEHGAVQAGCYRNRSECSTQRSIKQGRIRLQFTVLPSRVALFTAGSVGQRSSLRLGRAWFVGRSGGGPWRIQGKGVAMSEQPQQGRMQRRDEEDSALDLRQSDPDELHERPEPDPLTNWTTRTSG
jgi:hypothetical protein